MLGTNKIPFKPFLLKNSIIVEMIIDFPYPVQYRDNLLGVSVNVLRTPSDWYS